jgi:protoheme IX farnesyltransferase
MQKHLAIISDLIKYKLSLAVVLSSVAGYYLYSNSFDHHLFFLALGVFFLASGAAVLNQYTERAYDSLMERTKNRPIPSKKIKEQTALSISSGLLLAGCLFLLIIGIIPFVLGVINVLLYNLLYTFLKKKSILSIIPGALVGAVPPLIGFSSAGGNISSLNIIVYSVFMFLWQLPHFWLILIKYGKDYENAGFASLTSYLTELQIKQLTFFWVFLTTCFLFSIGIFSDAFSRDLIILFSILNTAFIFAFYRMLFFKKGPQEIRGAFIMINSFSIIVMFMIIALSVLKN